MSKQNSTSDSKGVVIDFYLATNPMLLFETLVVFRAAGRQLFIDRLSAENVQIDWRDNDIADFYFDLRDPALESFLKSDFDTNSLDLSGTNLPLALKMFRHAVDEGFIKIVDVNENIDTETRQLLSEIKFPIQTKTLVYPEHGGESAPIMISPDWPRVGWRDLTFAVSNSHQLATGNQDLFFAKTDPLEHGGLLAKVHDTVIGEVLMEWHPETLYEILGAIDSAKLFPRLVERVIAAEDDKQYLEDVKLYLPR